MIPPWLRLTIIVAAGLAGLWLLFRGVQWALRNRFRAWKERPARSITPWKSHDDSALRAEQQPLAATQISQPEVDPDSILRQEAAVVPAADLPVPADEIAGVTILKSGSSFMNNASGPASVGSKFLPTPVSQEAPGEWRPAPWADAPLLSTASHDGKRLPLLRAGDIPLSRNDDYVMGGLTPTLAEMLPDSAERHEESRRELESAGYYSPHALQNLAAVRYLAIMGGLVLAGVLLILLPTRLEWLAIAALIAFPLLGWALPRLYVRSKGAERRSEIERGMPDLLDMLNMCVSQGLTIPDALRRILPDLRGPYPALAQELRIVNQQASIGTMQTALENFSRRMDIPEVHSFASLLTQTEKMGTSISESLASYSDTMRESLKQRADEKGNRATFRLLFPTVLCLMPAVYLFLLGPAIVELSNFFASGGRDSLDQGTAVIQRINQARGIPGPRNP